MGDDKWTAAASAILRIALPWRRNGCICANCLEAELCAMVKSCDNPISEKVRVVDLLKRWKAAFGLHCKDNSPLMIETKAALRKYDIITTSAEATHA